MAPPPCHFRVIGMTRFDVSRYCGWLVCPAQVATLSRGLWLTLACAATGWALFQCYRINRATVDHLWLSHSLREAESLGMDINGLPEAVFRRSTPEATDPVSSHPYAGRLGLIFVTAPGCSSCAEGLSQWVALIGAARPHVDRVVLVVTGQAAAVAKAFVQDRSLRDGVPWEARTIENLEAFETETGIVVVPNAIVFNRGQDVLLTATGVLSMQDLRTAQAVLLQERHTAGGAISLPGLKAVQFGVSDGSTADWK